VSYWPSKRFSILPVVSSIFFLVASHVSLAAPTIEEIENDIRDFRAYFQQRFPDVALNDYNDGVNALPQYAHRRLNWELLMASPPYESEMEIARQEWRSPFANSLGFDDCFSAHPPANEFPYFQNGRIHTIVGAINDCLQSQAEATLDPDSAKLARLVAAFREKSNGKPLSVDYSDEGMRSIYEQGRKYYWTRRGQLNFSCASCHVENAGNRLRGDVLSAGLGQTTGFPVYRTRWAMSSGDNGTHPWGTIHRRYAVCDQQAGAAPFDPQSPEYIALEVYQAIMNSGITLKVPSQRQ
jgi:sulfur-oxidizing protein SoxA